MSNQPLVEVENLNVDFPLGRSLLGKPPMLRAVNDVSLKIMPQTFFGLVGDSGSGKTTLGRAMLRAAPITSGTISFNHGNTKYDVGAMSKMELKEYRKKAQLIFQTREEADQKVREIASKCRLNLEHLRRFPHAFSGGQRQRISIARTLVCSPNFVVADESVAALDVSIQADILNLLKSLQNNLGLTFLFISHDLSVVAHICDTVAVMYLGTIVESAPTRSLFTQPKHPYTKALLSAIPTLNPEDRGKAQKLEGEIPSPVNPPSGCRFPTRCPVAEDRCRKKVPQWREFSPGHSVACHLVG